MEQSQGAGIVRFPTGTIEFASSANGLGITITTDDAAAVPAIKHAVAIHLDRMAWREAPLHTEWSAWDVRGSCLGNRPRTLRVCDERRHPVALIGRPTPLSEPVRQALG